MANWESGDTRSDSAFTRSALSGVGSHDCRYVFDRTLRRLKVHGPGWVR